MACTPLFDGHSLDANDNSFKAVEMCLFNVDYRTLSLPPWDTFFGRLGLGVGLLMIFTMIEARGLC